MAAMAATVVALLSAGAAHAHHSFAMYDAKKHIALDGTVQSFQWTNPHVVIELLAAPPDGGSPLV